LSGLKEGTDDTLRGVRELLGGLLPGRTDLLLVDPLLHLPSLLPHVGQLTLREWMTLPKEAWVWTP